MRDEQWEGARSCPPWWFSVQPSTELQQLGPTGCDCTVTIESLSGVLDLLLIERQKGCFGSSGIVKATAITKLYLLIILLRNRDVKKSKLFDSSYLKETTDLWIRFAPYIEYLSWDIFGPHQPILRAFCLGLIHKVKFSHIPPMYGHTSPQCLLVGPNVCFSSVA